MYRMSEGLEVIFIFGAFFLVMGLFNLYRCLSRRNWPETVGKIQKNEVRQITSSWFSLLDAGILSDYSSKSYAGTDKEMALRLSYVYVVENFKYIGDQLYSSPIVKVRKRIGGLHEGSKVKVFYNKNNPEKSFLAHSFAWPSLLVMSFGLILMGGSVYVHLNP